MTRDSLREICAFIVIGLGAFLIVCVFSYDPLDYLEDRHAGITNAGGRVGAAIAHTTIHWVGKAGAYGVAVILALLGIMLFFRRRVEQWGWKLAGSALFVVILSCYEVAVFDHAGGADSLAGGLYGDFFYRSLLEHLSTFGTHLILLLATLVAFILATDTLLYPALARSQQAIANAERWERLVGFVGDRVRSPAAVARLRSLLTLGRGRRSRRGKPAKAHRKRRAPVRATKPKSRADATAADATSESEADLAETDAETQASSRKKPLARTEASGHEREEEPGDLEEEEGEEEEYDEEEDFEEDEEDYEDTEDEEDEDEEDEDYEDEEDYEEDEDEETDAEESAAANADARPAGELKIREPVDFTEPPRKRKASPPPRPTGPYHLPDLDLIEAAPLPTNFLDKSALAKTASKIETTLRNFKIDAHVVEVQKGPTITQFEVSLAAGIKVHKIMNLADDLAMALKAQSIRIIAPIPGKSTVGIEVPNDHRSMVGLRELIEVVRDKPKSWKLPLALGRDTAGAPVIGDLGEMPHLLIAGSTGSGKSVCINSIIISVLMTRTPDEVKMILVDPKMVELAQFEEIPHLLCPVVTDMKKAPSVLNWLVDKMDERYELLAMAGVRHIASYNELGAEKLRERLAGKMSDDEIDEVPEKLPFVVVVIDELADLMMTAAKEVEGSITRLSQKSRAVGIHVILATQRPSVDVITGLIKANMPSRISFRVTSRVDSRTILDRNGADKLLGKGDCLYLPPGTSDVIRVQGAYLSDKEIRDIVDASAREAEPQYNPELTRFGIEAAANGVEEDELFEEAVQIVLGSQRGSVTLLQRQLQIGYTRASRLMELLHERGLVGPFQGSKAREVYYTLEEWEKTKARAKGTRDYPDE